MSKITNDNVISLHKAEPRISVEEVFDESFDLNFKDVIIIGNSLTERSILMLPFWVALK